MNDRLATYEVRDGTAIITLNRPQKLNAINLQLADELNEIWGRFQEDVTAKVAVLRAEGKAFSVGADIKEERPTGGIPWATRIHRCWPRNGFTVFKPIVGAVHGYALGAGKILAVESCDVTLAAESARFGYPEPRAGMITQPTEYVPGYMPFKASLEFHMLAWQGGELVDAERAVVLGMANRVVPDDSLMEEALRWADLLQRIPPLYIRSLKRGHYRSVARGDRQLEAEYLDYVWPQEKSRDFQEALQALTEGREPTFTGE